MTNNDLEHLRKEILELNQRRWHQILEKFPPQFIRARLDNGLDPIPPNVHDREEDIDEAVLHHPTSLCYDALLGHQITTFSTILTSMSLNNRSIHDVWARRIDLNRCLPVPKRYLLVSDRLHSILAPDATSMLDERLKKGRFICLRCHPLQRRPETWASLVCPVALTVNYLYKPFPYR